MTGSCAGPRRHRPRSRRGTGPLGSSTGSAAPPTGRDEEIDPSSGLVAAVAGGVVGIGPRSLLPLWSLARLTKARLTKASGEGYSEAVFGVPHVYPSTEVLG